MQIEEGRVKYKRYEDDYKRQEEREEEERNKRKKSVGKMKELVKKYQSINNDMMVNLKIKESSVGTWKEHARDLQQQLSLLTAELKDIKAGGGVSFLTEGTTNTLLDPQGGVNNSFAPHHLRYL